jgi:hypothetical protein
VVAGTSLVSLFEPGRYNNTALTFRYKGPYSRFDHHRGEVTGDDTTPRKPAADEQRGVYYAAFTLSSCIVEIFGDEGIIRTDTHYVSRPTVTRDLLLLDLRGSGAMLAGTISALAKVRGRPITQAWSRYFYENLATYKEIDGLIYSNAHNDEDAIVVYERAEAAVKCPPDQFRPLANPALRASLLEIAFKHNLKPLM